MSFIKATSGINGAGTKTQHLGGRCDPWGLWDFPPEIPGRSGAGYASHIGADV